VSAIISFDKNYRVTEKETFFSIPFCKMSNGANDDVNIFRISDFNLYIQNTFRT